MSLEGNKRKSSCPKEGGSEKKAKHALSVEDTAVVHALEATVQLRLGLKEEAFTLSFTNGTKLVVHKVRCVQFVII